MATTCTYEKTRSANTHNITPQYYPFLHARMNRESGFEKCQTASIISTANDEETKTRRFDELRQDYENAVDWVAQSESIIKTLQEQLASKDETIASLEEKLVQMALELASSNL